MIRIQLFILFLLFFITETNGQVPTDSLPKNSLLKNYELVRITEYNKETMINPTRNKLSFLLLSDQKTVDLYKQKYKLGANLNDTIIMMEWDVEKKAGNSERLPDAGLFKLNAGGKVTIKKSRMSPENKRVIVERKFKIFKWNESALILQDISTPDVNRVYTFK